MKIVSYLPCDGWYFVYDNGRERVLTRLASWAVVEQEDQGLSMVGMVSIRRAPAAGQHLMLEPVPVGTEGCYVHEHDLSHDERAVLERYKGVG